VYALNTIKTNGILGILDAIDRLTRCNGMSPEKYPIDKSSQRFYDPVKKIRKKK
jgi:putative component of membrane protein insertase Oxa1/YidC/SpoIIIJ protein YidD